MDDYIRCAMLMFVYAGITQNKRNNNRFTCRFQKIDASSNEKCRTDFCD